MGASPRFKSMEKHACGASDRGKNELAAGTSVL
jgi:hypothetical protein